MMRNEDAVRFALHGYGYIGRVHVLASQLNIAAAVPAPVTIWDTAVVRHLDSASAHQAKKTFACVTDQLSALADRDIDAIDIASPNIAHTAAIEHAVKAQWGIYCEKPVSHTLAETKRLAALVNSAGLTNQVALIYRFHPAVIEARDWISSGSLGRPLTFRAELMHGGYLNPQRAMSWRLENSVSGGGATIDLGIHLFDTIHMLLGQVARVSATTETLVKRRQGASGEQVVDVDDWASATLWMQDGAVGTVEVSRVHYGRERDFIEIVCEKGVVYIPLDAYCGAQVHTYRADVTFAPPKHSPVVQPLGAKFAANAHLNLHATSLAAFTQRMAGAELDIPVATFDEAVAAQAVVEAVLASGQRAGEHVVIA